MKRGFAVALLLGACLGCSRTRELFPEPADAEEEDAGFEAIPWGTYVAGLGLPDCPAAPALLVNTRLTEISGGRGLTDPAQAGPTLSFPEAMWIAANRPGPDTIRFDAEVFPPEAPGTIRISATDELPPDVGPICLDGRGRGVVFDWTADGMGCQTKCFWWLTQGSLQVGVTLLHMPYALKVSSARVAGCRIGNDGTETFSSLRASAIEAFGDAVIGPGNVFSDPVAIRVLAGASGVRILGNEMGVDPVTRADLGLIVGVELQGEAVLEDNLFGASTAEPLRSVQASATARLERNLIGVDRGGSPSSKLASGLYLAMGNFDVGPGNVIRGTPNPVRIGEAARVRLTRNSITGNGAGITFVGTPPVVAPMITFASESRVKGTCPGPGTVEVFSDSGDEAEQFLGTAPCIAGSSFDLVVTVPVGRNVTATLTDGTGRTSGFSAPVPVP